MASNPIGLLVAAFAVLGGIVATYISQTASAQRAENLRATAIDGTIIKSKELRDAYNEGIVTLKEVENAYAVLNGTLSETEAAFSNIAEKNRIAIQEVNNETKAKLEEATGFWTAFSSIINPANIYKDITTGTLTFQRERAEIEREGQNKLLAINIKGAGDKAKIIADQAKKDADKVKTDQKKANDEFLRIQKEFEDMLKSLREKSIDAGIQGLKGTERIEAERKLNQQSLDELKKSIEAKGKKINSNFQLTEEQQKQFAIISNEIDRDANEKKLKLNTEFEDKAKKDVEDADKEALETALRWIKEEQQQLEEANKAKVLLTKEGSKERLDAEIEAIEKERDFIINNTELTTDQRIILEQEALKKIADLQKDFSEKNQFSLAKFLGISDKQLDELQKALSRAGQEIKKFLDAQFDAQNKLLDSELQANEDSKKAKEDKIKDLQSQLQTELELQRQGLANNVDAILSALATEEQAKNADLENEKRIKEEKRKLALAQLAIDSASQASSIGVAIANLVETWSTLPFGVGLLAAFAQGFAVLGFIASTTAKAKAINVGAGFQHGGHTGNGGEAEVAGVVHGQEFVSTAKTTRKHRGLLEAIHQEDYSHLTIKDLAPLLEGTGVTFNKEVLKEIRTDQAVYSQKKANEPMLMLLAMKETNKKVDMFFNHVKNKPTSRMLPNGDIEITNGNSKRIIRKK